MLRAREPRLLNSDRCERMLDASGFEEAAKMLVDCGYEDMSSMTALQIEEALTAHRTAIFRELDNIAPDHELVDLFRLKYDYHNAKVILKAEAMNMDGDALLSDSGRISGSDLKLLYNEEKYSAMPGALGEAMDSARSILARTANPQLADFALDSAYFGELRTMAGESGNEYLQGYAAILIDCANLKSAVRTIRMGKDADFMKTALISGGSIDVDRILASPDKESLAALYAHTKLEDAALAGAAALDGAGLTGFELACDNAVNAYLREAKLVSYGPEAVVAYVAAVENEITAVRMILTGRLADVKPEKIRERLRDLYV